MIGLALEQQLRTLTAKPEVAAIFLMVNGLILFAAERFRRRAEVRELAIREGAKPDGGRDVWRRSSTARRSSSALAQSTALVAGISRDGVTMGAGLARGLDHSDSARFAFLLATPIILAAGLVKLPDLVGHLGDGIRGQALVGMASAAVTARVHGRVPRQILQDADADAVRHLLPGVRRGDGDLHDLGGSRRRLPAVATQRRWEGRFRRRLGGTSLMVDARPADTAEDVRDPQPGVAEVGLLRQISPRVVKRARLEALVLLPLFVGVVLFYDNRVSLLGAAGAHGTGRRKYSNRRSKRR